MTKPDAKPWARSRISFDLHPGSFTSLHQLPPSTVKVVTDGSGAFVVQLWANDEGDIPSAYTCTLPNADIFGFVLPVSAPSPIELSVLRLAGITQQHPQYQTVIDFIAQYLAAVGLGSADQVVLNPAIVGLGTTVQSAIAVLREGFSFTQSTPSDEWIVNHNFGIYPSVEVFTSGGAKVLADYLNVSANQLRVYFAVPSTGLVRCSF